MGTRDPPPRRDQEPRPDPGSGPLRIRVYDLHFAPSKSDAPGYTETDQSGTHNNDLHESCFGLPKLLLASGNKKGPLLGPIALLLKGEAHECASMVSLRGGVYENLLLR